MPSVVGAGSSSNFELNGLLTGSKWASLNLTYSFPAGGVFYGAGYAGGAAQNVTGFVQFNANQQAAMRAVFGNVAAVTNLTFTEIAETSAQHAVLREAQSSMPRTAESYNPNASNAGNEGGDSWFGTSRDWYADPKRGDYAYLTFLHEAGLALGLKDDTTGTALNYQHESMEFTVETYRSYIGASVDYGYSNGAASYAQSLMMYDIAALQTMYGANYANAGVRTVYSWNPATGEQFINGVGQGATAGNKIFLTVWDGSSNAAYDFGNYTTNLSVDLRPGYWSTVSAVQLADLAAATAAGTQMARGNIANAMLYNNDPRSLIRDAIGGSGNDTIVGNDADNNLAGGAGNDVLTGGAGNDKINGGAGNDVAVFGGSRASYQITKVGGGAIRVTDTRGGSPDGVDMLTAIEALKFADGTYTIDQLKLPGPALSVSDLVATKQQSLAATSLFSTAAADIQSYQFWQSATGPTGGKFYVEGAAQSTGVAIDVTASQLSQAAFVSGNDSKDTIWLRAFDGMSWGDWVSFGVDSRNRAADVSVSNLTATKGQSFAGASLFSASDANGDAITKYQFWDSTAAADSGNFVVGGVVQNANTTVELDNAALSATVFNSGSGTDSLWVRAFDGIVWSDWKGFNVTAPVNHAPVVTAGNVGAPLNYSLSASSLFSAADADNDTIAGYQIWDGSAAAGSGYFTVNGAVQAAGRAIDISAADLGHTAFVSASAATTDTLWIRATDGTSWSDWAGVSVTVPKAPKIIASDQVVQKGTALALTSLFTSVSPTGFGLLDSYQVWDGNAKADSGHFVVDGVAQSGGREINISAASLGNAIFQATGGSDQLWIRGYANDSWSDWASLTVTAPNHAPTVAAGAINATKSQVLSAASLLNVSDADGDAVRVYQFWDSTASESSGRFEVNGQAASANQAINISAADMANAVFKSGSGTDALWVRVSDGYDWSDWASFSVTAPANRAPILTTTNPSLGLNQSVAASTLFNVTDADGDAIRAYQFWDGTNGAGHFAVNGVTQATQQAIDVAAANLDQASFVGGAAAGTDTLWVRASDGTSWSDWKQFAATTHA